MRSYLIAMRKKAGMNQEQVAKRLGMCQASVAGFESGRIKRFRMDILKKLAKVYRVGFSRMVAEEAKYMERGEHGNDKC